MKKLKLSDGGYTLVDDMDYELLSKYSWRKNSQGYVRQSLANGKFLHRLLLKAPSNKLVDHINRNPLDNRRANLRLCTASENNVNMKLRKDNKSGFRGVSWHSSAKKWASEIKYEGVKMFIGTYHDLDEAIGARLTAELEYFGEFCNA